VRLARKDSRLEAQAEGVAAEAGNAWHAQDAAEVIAAFETGADGLSPQEARARLGRYGPNRLAAARQQSEILRFLSHFNNLLIYVLIAAAVLAASIGHFGRWRGADRGAG
jgi:magnesium-transporting ATPase (P-type)